MEKHSPQTALGLSWTSSWITFVTPCISALLVCTLILETPYYSLNPRNCTESWPYSKLFFASKKDKSESKPGLEWNCRHWCHGRNHLEPNLKIRVWDSMQNLQYITKEENRPSTGKQRNCSEVSSCHPSRAPVHNHKKHRERQRTESSFTVCDLHGLFLLIAVNSWLTNMHMCS